ncbi:hypothetical protein [Actinoallomurus bryophytorum]|nr:hypothetical protein [Actinoallomurus bryophytorum]
MFPPEPAEGRPRPLVVAAGLLVAFWVASAVMALWRIGHEHRASGRTGALATVAFWTVVFALVIWRVWRGGRTAIAFMARVAAMIGTVFLAGMVAFAVLIFAAPPGGLAPDALVYLLPGLLAGGALLTAGILLRRPEVSRWGGR